MDFDFKVPSTIPQDLLLIQDLIGTSLSTNVALKHEHGSDSLDSSDDSITSSNGEIESEDEVEADLAPRGDDSGISETSSDSGSHSDLESDASSSSDPKEGRVYEAPQRLAEDIEDEESGITAAATYLQTKNEVIDTNIRVPTISEVDHCDKLERAGEIMSIVGNIVIVRGFPVDHVNSLSMHTLDADSLLVFEDRKVLGYIYETFGPTSQPLYQVKFNQLYPLDTDKVRLSREVFHVPQRSHFVFIDQLKKLRGSDASNIHDEEPAEDEIEFSDDEREAAFRAQRRKRRGHSVSSSRQSTPAPSRIHPDDVVENIFHGSNPYDAHGPYDDDYHVTGPSRPPPMPYDDPYADAPATDVRVHHAGTDSKFKQEPNCESSGDDRKVSRGRGARGRGDWNRRLWNSSRRGFHNPTFQRTFDSDTDRSFPETSRTVEFTTGCGPFEDTIVPHSFIPSAPNASVSPETSNIQNYQQSFIQPHINPRFASAFGLTTVPFAWASHSVDNQAPRSQHWVNAWTVHGSARSESEGDTYRPM